VHAWTSRFEQLPECLRARCIHYKRWKRHVDGATAEAGLRRDVAAVEKTVAACEATGVGQLCAAVLACCFVAPTHRPFVDVSDADLLLYVELNADTARKLSKRLQKRFAVPTATWFAANRSVISFCSAALREKLRIAVAGLDSRPCPVCLETSTEMVITDCGHAFCVGCVKRLAGVDKMMGALHDLLTWARYHGTPYACPMCRRKSPIRCLRGCNLICSSYRRRRGGGPPSSPCG
jgi:hypothetical protein